MRRKAYKWVSFTLWGNKSSIHKVYHRQIILITEIQTIKERPQWFQVTLSKSGTGIDVG